MFIGEFEYRLDEKGRVPIPPKFRTEELKKEGLVLCQGMEKYITIYPPSEFKKLADALTPGPIESSKTRKLNRAVFATAFNAELDAQGRIMIPSYLRQYAGLTEEVVIAGVNNKFELWSKAQWDNEKVTSQEEARNIMETLENK